MVLDSEWQRLSLNDSRSSLSSDIPIISNSVAKPGGSEHRINNSGRIVDDEEEEFLQEHDPLSSEYDPLRKKSVAPIRRSWLIAGIHQNQSRYFCDRRDRFAGFNCSIISRNGNPLSTYPYSSKSCLDTANSPDFDFIQLGFQSDSMGTPALCPRLLSQL